jgi:hypothetical protein
MPGLDPGIQSFEDDGLPGMAGEATPLFERLSPTMTA